MRHESVTVDTLSLVHPQLDQFLGLLDSLNLGIEQTLEHVGQVTNVELVVEVLRSLTELTGDLTVQGQSCLDNDLHLLVDRGLKFAEVLAKISAIDLRQRSIHWHANCAHPEVSLETRIDNERSRVLIHGANHESALNLE